MDKLPNWLRWVLVPFAAIAVFLLIPFGIGIYSWTLFTSSETSPINWLLYHIYSPALSGYLGVISGCYVAPGQKFITSLVIGSLFMMLSGYAVFLALAWDFDFSMLVSAAIKALAAGTAIYHTKMDNEPIG